jgi:maltose O-acetyltransferase
MLRRALGRLRGAKYRLDRRRMDGRYERYRVLGMHLGREVALPPSCWIDEAHCFLISIGDHVGFGERCQILAHDAQMNEFLGVTRVGRVVIHESCHIGAGTIILPGVEIGPRTIVAAGSVVSRSLPPDTFCMGAPARAISPLAEYLERHERAAEKRPQFPYAAYRNVHLLTRAQRDEMLRALADGDGYIVSEPWLRRRQAGEAAR